MKMLWTTEVLRLVWNSDSSKVRRYRCDRALPVKRVLPTIRLRDTLARYGCQTL
jgi:hypothetical protein